MLFVDLVASPAAVLGVLAVLALPLAFLLRRTSWRPVDPLPVVARRRAGEIVRASAALYRRRPAVFAALGLIAVPVGAFASSFLPAAVLIGVLSLSAIGLPVAAWLSVRYQFAAQVVMLEGTGGWRALRRSGGLVRHRWWHTAVIAVLVWAGVQAVALLVGLLLVTVTGLPLWAVTGVAVAAQVLLVPLGATVLTLLYGDARAQHDESVPEPDRQPELAGT